jgi:hypothetical protein
MKLVKLFFSTTIFIWCMGFFYFLHTTNNLSNNDRTRSESIIVWGDDVQAIYTSIQLIKLGYANMVFITNDDNETTLREFLKSHNAVQEQFVFNKNDANTDISKKYNYANATYAFLKNYHLNSIRLVVNAYQLPRAMKELGTILPPEIEIIPHPISQKEQDSYRVFKEYAKYTLLLIASFIGKENEFHLSYS